MGVGPFRRKCSAYPNDVCSMYGRRSWKVIPVDQTFPSAPDPINFEILEIIQVKNHVVAKIKYPDCTNFEGIKICLFVYTTISYICGLKSIDPHFSEDSDSPFARFKPNEVGWKMAIEMAKMI